MENNVIKGFKVFNPDWTCRDKQYTCPGHFEEDVTPSVCNQGIHFCKKAVDCFNYYKFNPENKVAEVAAYGTVVEEGAKCCTDKLEIIREIPWQELLEIVNVGKSCTGFRNSGNRNSGDYNSGSCNSGNRNSGNRNSGSCNSGNRNSGSCNSGNRNSGNRNSGSCNSGSCNSGNRNSGDYNSGSCNSGSWNSGNYNSGCCNSGSCNSGNRNSGDYNSGSCNSGSWNSGNYNSGCFNTIEPKIHLFNKPSEWTYQDWLNSEAIDILNNCPANILLWIGEDGMTYEEKTAHPEYSVIGGFLKQVEKQIERQMWWDSLSDKEKDIVMQLPNFDKSIFKEITGIDVDKS